MTRFVFIFLAFTIMKESFGICKMRLLVPTWQRVTRKRPISILCRCHDVGPSSRDGVSFTGKESRTYSKWRNWRLYKMGSRGMIRLKGVDIVPFLQGMVTNDVSQLVGDRESMYTMILNPQVCHSW